jgi:hypothetical protein
VGGGGVGGCVCGDYETSHYETEILKPHYETQVHLQYETTR